MKLPTRTTSRNIIAYRSWATAPLVGLCLALAACGNSGSHARLPVGVVDSPVPNQTITGNLTAAGWALSEDRMARVSIYLDRVYLVDCMLGTSRPDVGKAFPSAQDGDHAGWTASLGAASLPEGRHELVFEAATTKGAIRDIGIVPVTIVH